MMNKASKSKGIFCESFPPLVSLRPKVLILGSMPGVRSLQAAEYYAHPQNAFWKIMSALFNMPAEGYAQKTAIITQNNLALWDVLKSCEREGSLDTAIRNAEINDFKGFFAQYPSITHVFFNGGKAETEFMRRVAPALENVPILRRLPSTSPAHAGLSFKDKMALWKAVKV
jgi:double-stranded uracil-DNA glycosylase